MDLHMDAPEFGRMAPGDRGPALRSYVERYLAWIEDPNAATMTAQAFNRRLFAINRFVRSAEEHGTALPPDLTARVSAATNSYQSQRLADAKNSRPRRTRHLRQQSCRLPETVSHQH